MESPRVVENVQIAGTNGDEIAPSNSSAAMRLAHLDLLKYIVASEYESVLIIEDDVDFDVRIKEQMKLVSDNVRAYTGSPRNDELPYGQEWDVLWRGQCDASIGKNPRDKRKYRDDSRLPTASYSGWSFHYLQANLEDDERCVHESLTTACSSAYTVTLQSAPKVANVLGTGADEAFDVALSAHCRSGDLR